MYTYYSDICLVHLIIIDAFLAFIFAIKNNDFSLVDIYKTCNLNYALIDKFYANYNNNITKNAIILNYNTLFKVASKVKEDILQYLSLNNNVNIENTESIIYKLKIYSKESNNFLNYLYLYDIFGS